LFFPSKLTTIAYVSDDFGRTWKNGGMAGSRIQSFVFVPRAQQ
jgi:hypothetical protein